MLEQQDLKEITTIVTQSVGALERRIDERFDNFAGIINRSIAESENRISVRLDGVDQRIDKLYSLVDSFIALHQKLDQELTMLRARMDRMEQELQSLRKQTAH